MLANVGEPHVEIAGHRFHQRLKLAVEEMVRARNGAVVDGEHGKGGLGLRGFGDGSITG